MSSSPKQAGLLHLDQRQRDFPGILQPMGRSQVTRCLVLAYQHGLIIARDECRTVHHDPVLGAMEVLFANQQPLLPGLTTIRLNLKAVALDQALEAPGLPVAGHGLMRPAAFR